MKLSNMINNKSTETKKKGNLFLNKKVVDILDKKIEKINISDNIILLIFDNQLEITSTFLRFQEYYESPEFSWKIFSLNEYKEWYTSEMGSFSYYNDWNWFNIPSYILKPFYEWKFKDLSYKEKRLLDIFKNKKEDFYIIWIHKEKKDYLWLLKHEVAHWLFYTDLEYRNKVLDIINKYDIEKIKEELLNKWWYNKSVVIDEVHAYSIHWKLNNKNDELIVELKENYKKYFKKNKIDLEKFNY